MAKNKVIKGDYNGCSVMCALGMPYISTSITKSIELTKGNISSYDVYDETKSKSVASVAGRGLLGGFLLGPAGLLAGALTAKSKGSYVVAVQFKDGAKSLLEIDEKIYKAIMKQMF